MRRSRSGCSESTSTTPFTSPRCSEANSCAFMPPSDAPASTYGGFTPAFPSRACSSAVIASLVRGFGPGSDAAIPARS